MQNKSLEVLRCPIDKSKLIYNEKKQILICTKCRQVYAVRNGIPVMLHRQQ